MFCSNCGKQIPEESKFCAGCGAQIGDGASTTPSQETQSKPVQKGEEVIWTGQPSGLKGKAQTATKTNAVKYKLTTERLIIESGLISKKRSEMELYKIKDLNVSQSISERLQKIGTVTVISNDSTDPRIELKDVDNPQELADLIRQASRDCKRDMGISYRQDI